jgi:hypothetical protein
VRVPLRGGCPGATHSVGPVTAAFCKHASTGPSDAHPIPVKSRG